MRNCCQMTKEMIEMPGRDGMGPMGMGPKSGGGFGPCTDYSGGPCNGYGPRFDRRFGCRRTGGIRHLHAGDYGTPAMVNPDQRKALLKNQARVLEDRLQWIKDQLDTHAES